MPFRRHNLFWLLAALLLLIQSALPTTAVADASMRCAGMRADTSCARLIAPLAEMGHLQAAMSAMPCCRHMTPTCPMARGRTQISSAAREYGPCLVTMQVRESSHAILRPVSSRWMFRHAPALAPPAPLPARSVSVAPVTARPASAKLAPPGVLTRPLRGPPSA